MSESTKQAKGASYKVFRYDQEKNDKWLYLQKTLIKMLKVIQVKVADFN